MEEQKPRDIKVEPQKEKVFPFKVQMNGSTPSTCEIGGLNAPVYELAEGT